MRLNNFMKMLRRSYEAEVMDKKGAFRDTIHHVNIMATYE